MARQSSGAAVSLRKEIFLRILLCYAIQGAAAGIWKIRNEQASFLGITTFPSFVTLDKW